MQLCNAIKNAEKNDTKEKKKFVSDGESNPGPFNYQSTTLTT